MSLLHRIGSLFKARPCCESLYNAHFADNRIILVALPDSVLSPGDNRGFFNEVRCDVD